MEKEAARVLSSGEDSILAGKHCQDREKIKAEDVAEAARNGDVLAIRIIARSAWYLGVGLVNLVNIFNPGMIVIGGGVSQIGDMLLEPARQMVKDKAFRMAAGAVRIVASNLGEDAALLGAASFTFNRGKL
jgi:glucokinase